MGARSWIREQAFDERTGRLSALKAGGGKLGMDHANPEISTPFQSCQYPEPHQTPMLEFARVIGA